MLGRNNFAQLRQLKRSSVTWRYRQMGVLEKCLRQSMPPSFVTTYDRHVLLIKTKENEFQWNDNLTNCHFIVISEKFFQIEMLTRERNLSQKHFLTPCPASSVSRQEMTKESDEIIFHLDKGTLKNDFPKNVLVSSIEDSLEKVAELFTAGTIFPTLRNFMENFFKTPN